MKNLVYIFLMFINISLFSQNIWEVNHNINEDTPLSIECPDSSNCFVLVENNSYIPSKTILYKSSNQGKDWFPLSTIQNKDFFLTVNDMSCSDTNNLFLSFMVGTIYKSTNGGKQFDIIKIDTLDLYEILHISMRNKDTGIVSRNIILITYDGWKTYEKFSIFDKNLYLSYRNPKFINNSILYCIVYDLQRLPFKICFLKLNINSKKYELNLIDKINGDINDLCIVNENLLFACGKSNTNNGGSGNDAIYKSSDAGKSWRRVIDLSTTDNKLLGTSAFGLQSIAFKDSLTGMAVGQFGKFAYTYDGGESWIYESKLHDSIYQPATMKVRYAGSVPIVTTFDGYFFRMIEDNLAPKAEDIYSISGRVWLGDKGQPGVAVALGYRITMTDENGYYKFTRLTKGNYTVKAINKYYDGVNPDFFYKPFDYTPVQYNIDLTHDTTGFDFNGTDLRIYYNVGGYIRDSNGKKISGIEVQIEDSVTTSDADGHYYFKRIVSKMQNIIPRSNNYKFTPWHYELKIKSDTNSLNFSASAVTDVVEEYTDKGKIVIYPNPAGDYIEIQPSEGFKPSEGYEIQIFDMLGTVVFYSKDNPTPSLPASREGVRIDVSFFSPGIYVIKIGNKVEKFVKM